MMKFESNVYKGLWKWWYSNESLYKSEGIEKEKYDTYNFFDLKIWSHCLGILVQMAELNQTCWKVKWCVKRWIQYIEFGVSLQYRDTVCWCILVQSSLPSFLFRGIGATYLYTITFFFWPIVNTWLTGCLSNERFKLDIYKYKCRYSDWRYTLYICTTQVINGQARNKACIQIR